MFPMATASVYEDTQGPSVTIVKNIITKNQMIRVKVLYVLLSIQE